MGLGPRVEIKLGRILTLYQLELQISIIAIDQLGKAYLEIAMRFDLIDKSDDK